MCCPPCWNLQNAPYYTFQFYIYQNSVAYNRLEFTIHTFRTFGSVYRAFIMESATSRIFGTSNPSNPKLFKLQTLQTSNPSNFKPFKLQTLQTPNPSNPKLFKPQTLQTPNPKLFKLQTLQTQTLQASTPFINGFFPLWEILLRKLTKCILKAYINHIYINMV